MKKKLQFLSLIAILILTACESRESKLQSLLEKDELLSKDFFKNGTDTNSINSIIREFHEYVKLYPEDTSSARLLFRMGDLFRIKNESAKSVECYNQVYLQHSASSLHPVSLFMMGFVCENDLHDLTGAANHYTLFLQKFQGHPLCKDARFALDNLGKSPQQLLEELQQKNIDSTDSL